LEIVYHYNVFFWVGITTTLEEQALLPIENPNEMGEDWISVEKKIRNHHSYPTHFRKAFGINSSSDIDRTLVSKAIAQFEKTIVSSGNSKYDRVIRGEAFFTEDELEGYEIFFDASLDLPDGECAHCHNAPLFTINDYLNNGLQPAETFNDFEDPGFGITSGKDTDMGKFKIPTLRNIEFSAPYMHDGRFETLEEVMDHYLSGGHPSPNKDPLIYELKLNSEQANQIIIFLKTLSDTSALHNKNLSSPFN
jgi:cytochrome c peroxidase